MSRISSDNHSSSYDAVHPSPPLGPQRVEMDDHEALTLHDDSFSIDFLDVEGFGFADDPFLIRSPQVPPPAGLRNVKPFVHTHVIGEPQRTGRSSPQEPQRPSSSVLFPEPIIHPAVAPQSHFDGTYSLRTHSSAWYPAGTTSYGGGGQAALAGGHNMAVPVPSMSGTMPVAMMAPAAAPSFSSVHITVPTYGSPAGACTPVVRPWDAAAATTDGPFARAVPPASFCRCHLRAHPFVSVGDTIEWVRPDLMRMDMWFNWSPNAEAEAHGLPRRG